MQYVISRLPAKVVKKAANHFLVYVYFQQSILKESEEMTGLVRAKEYDWKDSNLALFGSDVEKKVKCK